MVYMSLFMLIAAMMVCLGKVYLKPASESSMYFSCSGSVSRSKQLVIKMTLLKNWTIVESFQKSPLNSSGGMNVLISSSYLSCYFFLFVIVAVCSLS